MPHASGTAFRYLTIEILMGAFFAMPAKSLLRDVEFPEHVLVKRVVDIDLDPVQSENALLELSGKLPVNNGPTRRGIHFSNDRIRTTAGFRVIVRADSLVAVSKAFGKESKIEERQISEMLITIPPDRRRYLIAGLSQHLEYVPHAATRLIFDAIHVFDLNEFRQQIR